MAQSPGKEEMDGGDAVSSVSSNSFSLSLSDQQEPNLADISILRNTASLSDDLKIITACPELCDVIFFCGEEREPVYGVRAVLAARSRVFHKMLFTPGCVTKKQHRKLSDVKAPNLKSGLGNLRLFNRRASDTVHMYTDTPMPQAAPGGNATQQQQIVVEEYDAEVFKKLLGYLHSGTVTFEPKTLLGLMNAAEQFGVEELGQATLTFMRHCVNVCTACELLKSAERYIQYKSTKVYVSKVMDFIDKNAESVLIQHELTELPEHVLHLILSREDIRACANTKFNAALAWSRAQLRKDPNKDLGEIFAPFVDVVRFDEIPAMVLMKEVKPLNVIPDNVLMGALAYQADPDCVAQSTSQRRPSGRLCDNESIGSATDLQDDLNKLSVKATSM